MRFDFAPRTRRNCMDEIMGAVVRAFLQARGHFGKSLDPRVGRRPTGFKPKRLFKHQSYLLRDSVETQTGRRLTHLSVFGISTISKPVFLDRFLEWHVTGSEPRS